VEQQSLLLLLAFLLLRRTLETSTATELTHLEFPRQSHFKRTDLLPFHSCTTCHLTSFDCPGHFGHIDLPAPVFHPLYMVQAFQLLRGSCTYCHRFLVNDVQVRLPFLPFLSFFLPSLFTFFSVNSS
jgi:hypothetical protein